MIAAREEEEAREGEEGVGKNMEGASPSGVRIDDRAGESEYGVSSGEWQAQGQVAVSAWQVQGQERGSERVKARGEGGEEREKGAARGVADSGRERMGGVVGLCEKRVRVVGVREIQIGREGGRGVGSGVVLAVVGVVRV